MGNLELEILLPPENILLSQTNKLMELFSPV